MPSAARPVGEQIRTHEEQEIIESLSVMGMCDAWNKELEYGRHFRPGIILIGCTTADTVDWLIVPKLTGWEGTELPTSVGDEIPETHS